MLFSFQIAYAWPCKVDVSFTIVIIFLKKILLDQEYCNIAKRSLCCLS